MDDDLRDDMDPDGGGGGKGGILKYIIFAVIGLVLAGGGIFVGTMLNKGDKDKPAVSKTNDDGAKKGSNKAADKKNADDGEDADNNDDDEDAEPKEFKSKSKSGILALDPFTVNLNDPFGRRYAEVVMNLEIEDKTYVTKISENELVTPKMRDEIFMIISAKSYSELKSTSGKVT
ncbi:MAG: flagellar basal body-associated FliL family protein, partial [bacterium]|nr:flagellar basal body-associated FliL family protein [bacterium]